MTRVDLLQHHAGMPLRFVRARRRVRAAVQVVREEARAGVPIEASYIRFMLALGIDPWRLR